MAPLPESRGMRQWQLLGSKYYEYKHQCEMTSGNTIPALDKQTVARLVPDPAKYTCTSTNYEYRIAGSRKTSNRAIYYNTILFVETAVHTVSVGPAPTG